MQCIYSWCLWFCCSLHCAQVQECTNSHLHINMALSYPGKVPTGCRCDCTKHTLKKTASNGTTLICSALFTMRLEKNFGSKGKQHPKHTASEMQTHSQ